MKITGAIGLICEILLSIINLVSGDFQMAAIWLFILYTDITLKDLQKREE